MGIESYKRSVLLLTVCCALHIGNANFVYKLFPGKKADGRNITSYINISSTEDCAAVCGHTRNCMSAYYLNGYGYKVCALLSSMNGFLCRLCDNSVSTAIEIDVTKGDYGCDSERDSNEYLPCTCERNWDDISCKKIEPCPFSLGYKNEEERCFKYHPDSEGKTQSDAAQACLQDGGHLFTLKSHRDIKLLLDEASYQGASPSAFSWIDGGDSALAFDGKPLPWTAWTTGSGSPPCVSLCHHDQLMEWHTCTEAEGYFCQVD